MILLRQVRESRGLSQAELSRRSGVKQQHISLIESGERENPGIKTLDALAVALNCDLRDLYKPEERRISDGVQSAGAAGVSAP